jgi:CubicO group peptidase (beta-lactamase class C family)
MDALADSVVGRVQEMTGATGIALGISSPHGVGAAATGVRSMDSGEPMTASTAFMIGSVTKVYTATLVMQLVEAGVISLSDPAVLHLPELLAVAPEDDAVRAITVRDLLTHSSGLAGDVFIDTGRNDDCSERLIRAMAGTGLWHEPGKLWAYCNSALVAAAVIVERHLRMPFWRCLEARICEPLGMPMPVVFTEDALRVPLATGHLHDGLGRRTSSARDVVWSMAAAGSRPWARVEDLLAFGRAHLPGATSLLSPATTALMQSHVLDHPQSLAKVGQGLGWLLLDDVPTPVLGHLGQVRGYSSALILAPEQGIVVAALANDDDGAASVFGCVGAVLGELGVQMSGPGAGASTSGPTLPHSAVLGRYERFGAGLQVMSADGGSLRLLGTETDADGTVCPVDVVAEPIGGLLYSYRAPGKDDGLVEFSPADDGIADGLWMGTRHFRRSRAGGSADLAGPQVS